MDFTPARQVRRNPVEPANTPRLAAAAPIRRLASEPRVAESTCFSAIRRSLERRRYAPTTINRILCSHRASTLAVYDKKWSVFESWCASQVTDPMDLGPNRLCDFFLYLFETKSLQPITIMGYCSAIARVYRLCGFYDPGADIIISALMDNFQIAKPCKTTLFPKWSLEIVLRYLDSEVFEP